MTTKLKTALREIFFLGLLIGTGCYVASGLYEIGAVILWILLGTLFAVPVWLLYRLLRFTFSGDH
jgi:membrane protein YdbS with pleckstrin-like domain